MDKRKVVDISEPILAEDSTLTLPALSVKVILTQLQKKKNTTHDDYLVALLLVLLVESGFHILPRKRQDTLINRSTSKFTKVKSTDDDDSSNSSVSDAVEYNQNKRLVHIPKNWKLKSGIYKIYFVLFNIESKLIVTSLNNVLYIKMSLCTKEKSRKKKVYKMTLQTSNYMDLSHPCTRISKKYYTRSLKKIPYKNLKEISHMFKDNIAAPLRIDILSKLDLITSILEDLPLEIQLKIFGMLEAQDLLHLAQCSHKLCEVSRDQQLWLNLIKKDFFVLCFYSNFEREPNFPFVLMQHLPRRLCGTIPFPDIKFLLPISHISHSIPFIFYQLYLDLYRQLRKSPDSFIKKI